MAPTDSIELEHSQQENKLNNENGEESVTHGGKCDSNVEEEMVTSFIESPSTEADKSLTRVDEEKRVDCTQSEAADQTTITDPGEGTSSQEKCKSVVINVPDEKPKAERAINGNQEKLVTNNTRAVTTTESPVQVFDDDMPEEKQETASTIKNTKRYEIVRWDNKRSCFFVFFLLLFFLWLIAYYLYASGWLYRKINNIRS